VSRQKHGDERAGHPSSLLGPTEPEDDSGAKPEVVLPIIEAVGDFRQEVLRLHGTNREVPRRTDINASSGGHYQQFAHQTAVLVNAHLGWLNTM